MRPDDRRPSSPAHARIDLGKLPLRDGLPDDDGVLAPLPGCPHCGGSGSIEAPEPPPGTPAEDLPAEMDPCGCDSPDGFSDWMEELLAELAAAPTLRDLARLLESRGSSLLQSLDRLETVRRRAPSTPAVEVITVDLDLWETDLER